MSTAQAKRAETFLANKRKDAQKKTLERVTVDRQTGDWLDVLTAALAKHRKAWPPVKANGRLDLRRRTPPWLADESVARSVSVRQLALVICDAILRPRVGEPDDFTARELPSPLTVADDIGRSLGVKGADRHESKRLREEFGMDLLGIAAECGLIEPLRVPGKRSRAVTRVQLSVAAEARLAEIYTGLVISGDLRTDQVVFDPPEPRVVVTSNFLGWDETPANDTPGVVAALNAAQRTGWRVNRAMLAHVLGDRDPVAEVRAAAVAARDAANILNWHKRDIYKRGEALKKRPKSAKLARDLDLLLRTQPDFEEAVDDTRAHLRRWLAITQATALQDQNRTFYYRYRFDYRGRAYSVGGLLNYTGGDDLVRSLLEFAERETLTPGSPGVGMLSVHLTAMLGNGMDKAPLQDRMNWAWSHSDEIVAHAAGAPFPGVEKADEPDRFRAACLAWRDHLAGRPVHVPCVFDATQSGLQMYSLLMRDEALGARVNTFATLPAPTSSTGVSTVRHTSPPNDFYKEVGDLAGEADRGTVKLLTNPQIYGAGFDKQCEILAREQGVADTDEEVRQRVKRIREAVEQMAPAFVAVSGWLKECARMFSARGGPLLSESGEPVLSKSGTPLVRGEAFRWTLGDGFVVLQDSRRIERKVERFTVAGYGRQLEYTRQQATKGISGKAQGSQVAANFIHALDGALLREIVRRGSTHGVKAWALAHDSFGCLPSQALILYAVLRPAVLEVFGPSPLNALAEQFDAQGVGAPPPVHPETLDPQFMYGDLVS